MTSGSSSSDSVFTDLMSPKFVQKDLKLMPEVGKPTLGDFFILYTTRDKKSEIKVYCELCCNVILIREGPGKKAMGFMDVSFSRLKLTISAEEKKLRLIKNKKYEELWNQDTKILQKWYEALECSCIYSNFRSDYDVGAVLGRGNFAKVYLVQSKATAKKFSAKIFDKQLIKEDEFEKVAFLHLEMFFV